MKTRDIYKNWPLGLAEFYWKTGAFDSSPATATITKLLEKLPTQTYQRRIVISAVDANTGGIYFFNNDNTEFGPDLVRAGISSAAMPFVFSPEHWRGFTFIDGGTFYNMDIRSAVQECLKIVDDESKIELDVFLTHESVNELGKSGNSISNFLEAKRIRKRIRGPDTFRHQLLAFPNVKVRHLMELKSEVRLSGLPEIYFEGEHTKPLQDRGK